MYAYAEAEAVEQRHRGEHPVAGAEHGVGRNDLLAEGVEVLVREDDALGGAGGAAGVEDDGGVVATAGDLIVIEAGVAQLEEVTPADNGRVGGDLLYLAPLGEHIARADGPGKRILDAGDNDVDDLGVLADVLKLVVELIQRNGRDAFGLVEVELDLLLGGEGMDHVGDAADEVDGIEHVYRLRAVGHGDGDLVVLAHADGLESLGAALYLAHELFIRGGLAHEVEGDVVGVCFGDLRHGLKHGAVKIVQIQGNLANVVLPRHLCSNFAHILSLNHGPLYQRAYLYSKPLGSLRGRSSSSGCSKTYFISLRLRAK